MQVNSDSEDELGRLHTNYASTESLWQNADDFWCVIGWGFNCSVAHKTRWSRWRPWLVLMLDVLESDLEQCASENGVHDSIFAQYLRPIGDGRSNKRRLMRAVLADGKQKSLAEFGEIWPNETRSPKQKKDDDRFRNTKRLDVENGEFGDYFDDSDDESRGEPGRILRSTVAFSRRSKHPSDIDTDSEASSTMHRKKYSSEEHTGIEGFGGVDSINLRRRALALLIRYCTIDPQAFLDTEDLFDLYTEFLRPLPLPVFQKFVLPSKCWLDPHEQSSLDQMLLRPLLSNAAPDYNENSLTQRDFELHYAPYCSNLSNVVDNAKLSLLVEDLLRLLWRSGRLTYSDSLKESVEEGIKVRKGKVSMDGRRKAAVRAAEDEEARTVLEHSGQRMLAILDMIQ